MVGAKRERVGSSHADRNGPTEFYPTIREARRGSGPRPTAATARNARAASVFLRLLVTRLSVEGRDNSGRIREEKSSVFQPVSTHGGRDPSRFRRVPRRRAGEFSVFPRCGEERAIRIARRSFSIREVVGNDNRRRKGLEGGDLC